MNKTGATAEAPGSPWQEAIALIAYPASFLFAITAFLWASTHGYPRWVSAYLPVILCAAVVLPLLERISPYRLDWRPDRREWFTDALYTIAIQVAMPPSWPCWRCWG